MIITFLDSSGKVSAESKPEFFKFPDGQPHVKINPISWNHSMAIIRCSIRNPDDLFNLRLVQSR